MMTKVAEATEEFTAAVNYKTWHTQPEVSWFQICEGWINWTQAEPKRDSCLQNA